MSSLGRKPRLFTVGHSDMSLDAFFRTMDESSIRLIADIRSNPASARFPHFERNALSAALENRGMSYRWFRSLGGLRPEIAGSAEQTYFKADGLRRYAAYMNTPPFQEALNNLVGLASSTQLAILCAERDPKNCHRMLLSDALVNRDIRVVHILGDGTAAEHIICPHLVIDGGKYIYKNKQISLF